MASEAWWCPLTVFCDLDIPTWSEKNRAPLHPDQTNIWVITCVNADNETTEVLVKRILRGMELWFDSSVDLVALFDGRAKYGNADNVDIKPVPGFPTDEGPVEIFRKSLETPPTLKAGNLATFLLKFDYRGTATSMPWPVYTSTFISRALCPAFAEVILSTVIRPSLPAAPPISDEDVFDRFRKKAGDTIDRASGEFGDKVSSLTIPLMFASAAIIVGGLVYLKKR